MLLGLAGTGDGDVVGGTVKDGRILSVAVRSKTVWAGSIVIRERNISRVDVLLGVEGAGLDHAADDIAPDRILAAITGHKKAETSRAQHNAATTESKLAKPIRHIVEGVC